MADLISRQALIAEINRIGGHLYSDWETAGVLSMARRIPAVDAVEVVRCQHCIHSVPFERNCELNTTAHMHCTLGRGEETLNVWHKYKKYYRDYSVVDRDGFCDEGERRGEEC